MARFSPWAMTLPLMIVCACLTGCGDSETTTDDGGDGGTPSTGGMGGDGGTPTTGGTGGTGGGTNAVCGDGTVATSEGCDDGNTAPGDGCDANCNVETGWECSGEPSACNVDCGDGIITAPEECDDGNEAASDGCDASCVEEAGYTCTGMPSTCVLQDGSCAIPFVIDLTDNAGTLEGTSTGDTTGGTNDVVEASCDGVTVGDGSDLVHTFTLPDARDVTVTVSYTGFDGIVRVLSAACDPTAIVAGEIAYGNGCADDAGSGADETVTLFGLPAGTYYVVVDAASPAEGAYSIDVSAAATQCGDGNLDGNEECDDMNSMTGDGCIQCTLEPMYTCTGEPSTCTSTCQDGTVDFALLEQCDDGNNVNNDRCDDTCQLEYDVLDAEPNDSILDSQAVVDGDIVFGTIEADDFDIYELVLAADAFVTLEVYTTIDGDTGNSSNPDGPLGTLIDCIQQGQTDPDLFLFDDTGDVTDSTDAFLGDDNDGVDQCPYVGANRDNVFLTAGTYYIRIDGWTASSTVPQYVLDVQVETPLMLNDNCDTAFDLCDPSTPLECDGATDTCQLLCGNGNIDPGEECDDANAIDDDRCSDMCVLNADVIDNGNNDTFGTAQALTAGQVAKGSITTGTDPFDLYVFTLATDSWVAVESYTTVNAITGDYTGPGLDDTLDCTDDTELHIFDAGGNPVVNSTAIATDDDGGDGVCSYIGPDDALAFLPAGTYYIKINEFGDSSDIAVYAIDLQTFAALDLGNGCNQAYDLCDPTQFITCGTGDTCETISPRAIDRTNWEEFDGAGDDFDLDATTLTFTPTGGTYGVVTAAAGAFPDTPGNGGVSTSTPALTDDGAVQQTYAFTYYGVAYSDVWINANGNMTFLGSDGDFSASVFDHFNEPRISWLFNDINPAAGGTVTIDVYADRLTVSFESVPLVGPGTGSVNMQVQLLNTGVITITHFGTTAGAGIVGLSAGDDIGNEPPELDFSGQTVKTPDTAGDLIINEFLAADNVADSNCDTLTTGTADEFVELVNVSGQPLDLTGVTISDGTSLRYTFPAMVLGHGRAVVVYGGGTSMCADVNGVVSGSSLSLNDGGDTITVANAGAMQLDQVIYGAQTTTISTTLDHDLIGVFRDHDLAGGSSTNFSPGFRATGDSF